LLGSLTSTQATRYSDANRTRHLPIGGLLLGVWAAGTCINLLGLIRGLRITRHIRRSAQPISTARIESARSELLTIFGLDLPSICISDQIAIPMAVGYLRPTIMVPASLLDKLDSQQLLQVLIHECAHAQRRDALAALYQRTLLALFWFHPLVYVASRLLDRLREEICDNYVLGAASAKHYAQTLLTIAESISTAQSGWFAPALIQSGKLESRISGLLHARRCKMTQLTAKKAALIAMCFVSSVIILSCFAGSLARAQDSNDFSHVVNLEKTASGDLITITEVRGPTDTLVVGNTYEVRGTYKLASHDRALLAVHVMVEGRLSALPSGGRAPQPPLPGQKMIIEKGDGSFTLQIKYWTVGRLHVSFYEGGSSFAGTLF
jgi:beta-lactamase regulating signal transducer with metallopeptidase domain